MTTIVAFVVNSTTFVTGVTTSSAHSKLSGVIFCTVTVPLKFVETHWNATARDGASGKNGVSDSVGARGGADIHLSPDGRFLYSSNRLKAEGIAIFAVDALTGLLTPVGYQPTAAHPRQFNITPNGHFLLCCCRDSNKIQVFRRDKTTGLLTDTGNDIPVRRAVCVQFL